MTEKPKGFILPPGTWADQTDVVLGGGLHKVVAESRRFGGLIGTIAHASTQGFGACHTSLITVFMVNGHRDLPARFRIEPAETSVLLVDQQSAVTPPAVTPDWSMGRLQHAAELGEVGRDCPLEFTHEMLHGTGRDARHIGFARIDKGDRDAYAISAAAIAPHALVPVTEELGAPRYITGTRPIHFRRLRRPRSLHRGHVYAIWGPAADLFGAHPDQAAAPPSAELMLPDGKPIAIQQYPIDTSRRFDIVPVGSTTSLGSLTAVRSGVGVPSGEYWRFFAGWPTVAFIVQPGTVIDSPAQTPPGEHFNAAGFSAFAGGVVTTQAVDRAFRVSRVGETATTAYMVRRALPTPHLSVYCLSSHLVNFGTTTSPAYFMSPSLGHVYTPLPAGASFTLPTGTWSNTTYARPGDGSDRTKRRPDAA